MKRIKHIFYLLFHPRRFADAFMLKFSKHLSDRLFIECTWRTKMPYKLNLDDPKTFNEKLQWLKLYNRRPEYTIMVDKYSVKKYVADIIGEEYVIPNLGVWDKVEDIEWDKLPNQFVLKCTHDSGGIVICRDKSKLDKKAAIETLRNSLTYDYYKAGREWPYRDVNRRIIAEKYIHPDKEEDDLLDYKFFCFSGKLKFFKVDYNRFVDHHANYYTLDGELLDFEEDDYPRDEKIKFIRPCNFDKMISLVKELSKDIPFVRVDLYNLNGQIYFGELTFYPASGWGLINPLVWDIKIGEYLKLPTQKIYG